MIYVVGNEQNYHFQVLSILLDRLGFKWGKELVHFSYGMVELPNGKMKSREGTVVDADDLMELMVSDALKTSMELGKFDDMSEEERNEIARIVGMGALKYFILKVDARPTPVSALFCVRLRPRTSPLPLPPSRWQIRKWNWCRR